MAEVRCWCCKHFVMIENLSMLRCTDLYGICKHKNKPCYLQSKVCNFFVLRQGLYTNKTIPKIPK